MFYKTIIDGYLVSIGTGGNTEITESEYNEILTTIQNKPTAQDGYGYRLKEDLTWEEYELPEPIDTDEDATESDYTDALTALGVTTNEEN